jgi:exopolyphosphatase/guanosine-5'-triphosphate,3'-diphosphate pyrophosphatase
MTKRDLSERLKIHFPELEKKDLEFIVDNFFEILATALKRGEKIELRGFGVLELHYAKPYFFTNPKNKQKYYLNGKARAVFHLGKELKERLNTPLLAGLDLGTQSFRLILGKELEENIIFLKSFRENVRLGEGLTESGNISSQAIERAVKALKSFKEVIENHKAKDYYAVGTAVFRKAQNAKEVLKKIAEETGFQIEVISPDKEAELTLLGLSYGLKKLGLNLKKFLIVDVGGGSTEFLYLKEGQPTLIKSLDLGAVSLKETFNLRYPLTRRLLESLRAYVRDQLKELPKEDFEKIVITGGSASLLGSLDLKLLKFDPERLHGHKITADRVEKLIQKLADSTLPRIRIMKGMEEGREDIALPGLVIYGEILAYFGKNELLLSEYGILEATLLCRSKNYNIS